MTNGLGSRLKYFNQPVDVHVREVRDDAHGSHSAATAKNGDSDRTVTRRAFLTSYGVSALVGLIEVL